MYNLNQYINKLNIAEIQRNAENQMRYAVSISGKLMSIDIKKRITEKGEGTNKEMPPYSEKKYKYNKSYFIKKSAFPENGKKTINISYKEFRDMQGFRTDIKNLVLRGDMMSKFSFSKNEDGAKIGFSSSKEGKKAELLEEQQKMTIFSASVAEKERYKKRVFTLIKRNSPLKF